MRGSLYHMWQSLPLGLNSESGGLGGRVLSYISHRGIGMCCAKGYGFCAFFYLETSIDFVHFGP